MKKERIGNWMQTFTGQMFWPIDPRPEEICIEDIAHALSLLCRFGGHCKEFYSVAEHSIIVSNHVGRDPQTQLWGLLHDASEAYLQDIVQPLKCSLPRYKEIETRLMEVVTDRFDLFWPQPERVSQMDLALLLKEKELLAPEPAPWNVPGSPMVCRINNFSPKMAEAFFLDRFEHLYRERD